MNEYVGDEFTKRDPAIRPLIENRPAIKEDHIRPLGDGRRALMPKINALIEARELKRIFNPHLGAYRLIRKLLDAHDDVAGQPPKLGGQLGKAIARERLELIERWRLFIGPSHAQLIRRCARQTKTGCCNGYKFRRRDSEHIATFPSPPT